MRSADGDGAPEEPRSPRPVRPRPVRPPREGPERVRSEPGRLADGEPGQRADPESGAPDSSSGSSHAPPSVRDVMRDLTTAPPEERVEPAWETEDREFEADGVRWVARVAGTGSYGTGRLGSASLMAIQFARADSRDVPEREALVPVGRFGRLFPEELAALLAGATPMEQDEERGR